MLQYHYDNFWVLNTGNDFCGAAFRFAATFLTLLYFDADGRPFKTRFNLRAQAIE